MKGLEFKQELATSIHWQPYVLVVLVLLTVLYLLAKYTRKKVPLANNLKLIAKNQLNAKTQLYVIHYEGRQLLIVDNQQHLVVRELT